ncbi:hypothetical protein R1flu_021433 [Riccia fluitans]|uniref:RING-CH-type domain-containing protein n=1 Tax=Riccia fluitans TaxID=41844 RepID=A0ABD1ZPP6_9MARC
MHPEDNKGAADGEVTPEIHVVDIGEDGEQNSQEWTNVPLNNENARVNYCRICQEDSEEAVMELGCQYRGELARAHYTCAERWFRRKATNKCEICQGPATNVLTDVILQDQLTRVISVQQPAFVVSHSQQPSAGVVLRLQVEDFLIWMIDTCLLIPGKGFR